MLGVSALAESGGTSSSAATVIFFMAQVYPVKAAGTICSGFAHV
jgi:hypothetical protein